jgi:hypothetical protein
MSPRIILSTLKLAIALSTVGALLAQQPAAPAAGAGQGGARGGARGAGGGGGQAAGARGAGVGGGPAAGGRGAQGRVPLFFKEEWANPTGQEQALTQQGVGNANLELKLYGPSSKEFLIAGSPTNETNPPHPWNGMCTSPCGLMLRDKTQMVDLTGLARIKWVTKMSGFHQVRPMVKLADGSVYVADLADGSTVDWQEREFSLSGLRWVKLDPERAVTTGSFLATIDLSKVDEVGYIDLLPGSGHGQGGWSDVAKFEVYGKPVPRQ